jgi:hypothetical protein
MLCQDKTSIEQLQAISVNIPKWLEVIVEGYQTDPQSKQLLTELSIIAASDKGFALVEGIIKHKCKIWLGNHEVAKQVVMLALHASGLGGHSGITATYHKIKSLFSWPNMKQDIQQYISKCQVCSQAKSEHYRLPRLLQPLPVPSQAWHTISLDFIEGIPKSKTSDTILVVIDKFSKYAHFIPLSYPYTALSVAQLSLNHVYKLHGLPTDYIR